MDKKPLVGVSICAVVLLVMGSLNNVMASNNKDTNKNFQSYVIPPFTTIIGLISKVNKTLNGYISFYTIFVIYGGVIEFENVLIPFMAFSKSETMDIPKTYIGILTKHFIFISLVGDWNHSVENKESLR